MATYIEVKQIRSCIGRPENQRTMMKAIGLGRIGRSVKLIDTPAARGLVSKVQHLVEVSVREGEVPARFGRRSRQGKKA
jgi:large subunit ribosomal protein L30